MFAILLALIFIRPFISSAAYPYLDYAYFTLLLVFLIAWFLRRGLAKKIQGLNYPLIFFGLSLIASLAFSQNKPASLTELPRYAGALGVFFVCASLNNKERAGLIHTIVLAAFIISLLALYQYFFGFRHLEGYIAKQKISDPFVLEYIGRKRIFFPLVTPNTLGGYLITVVFLSVVNKRSLWLAIPIGLALLLTKSLGAFLALSIGLGIYFHLSYGFKRRRVIFIIWALAIFILIFIARSAAGEQHSHPAFSLSARFNYWKDTLIMVRLSPLIGVGLKNFNLIQTRFAHNLFLQIWAEMGIFGAISFLWLIAAVLKRGFRNIKQPADTKYAVCLFAAGSSFLIHNLMDFTFFLPEIGIIWWAIMGLLL